MVDVKKTRADEIGEAVAAADKKKLADAEAADGTNAKILELLTSMSARLDKLEKPAPAADVTDDGLDDDNDMPNKMRPDGKKPGTAVALDDGAECAKAQLRADSVAQSHGMRSPPPMSGERPEAYRRRLARQWQHFSKTFKAVDLASVSGEALNGIEKSIYADAVAASHRPDVAEGTLMERQHTDVSRSEEHSLNSSHAITSRMPSSA